ncbi:MAG: MarR family winged helix-turn-helix transcriptional regulator [Chthoniobacterales bacterium]
MNTGILNASPRTPPDQVRADAERLSHIILEMQRCFLLHLSNQLAPGNVSFPQFFLLAYLDQKEMLTMSAIAHKMGHTTAAASGLVARLENLRFVVRSAARDDPAQGPGLHYAERLGPCSKNSSGNGGQSHENHGTSRTR